MGWLGVVAWLLRGRAGAMRWAMAWAMGSSAHCIPEIGGEPVRISSMVLLVAYAFYYKNVSLHHYNLYIHHM